MTKKLWNRERRTFGEIVFCTDGDAALTTLDNDANRLERRAMPVISRYVVFVVLSLTILC
jgi:hypothetical protein